MKRQIILDFQPPEGWMGMEPLADALEEFIRDYVGTADKALGADKVTAWWKTEPVT